jgi:predicted SAM-dependent methyltransferase
MAMGLDHAVQPDVVVTMTDMSAVATGSIDAIVSSHNIEHLYPHEVRLKSFCWYEPWALDQGLV